MTSALNQPETTISWWKITVCDSTIVVLDFIDYAWKKIRPVLMMPLCNDHLFQPLFVKGKWEQDQLHSTPPDTLALTELVYFRIAGFLITTRSWQSIEGKSCSVAIIWHTQSRSSCTAQETVS